MVDERIQINQELKPSHTEKVNYLEAFHVARIEITNLCNQFSKT